VLLQRSPQRVRQLWLSSSRDSAARLQELRALAEQATIEPVEVDDATLDKLVKQGAAALPQGFPIKPEVLGKLKTASFTATASKKHFALSTTLNCTDTKTANQLKGLLDVVIMGSLQPDANTPPEFKQVLKALKSEADEDSLTINVNVAYDLLLEQVKGQFGDAISAE